MRIKPKTTIKDTMTKRRILVPFLNLFPNELLIRMYVITIKLSKVRHDRNYYSKIKSQVDYCVQRSYFESQGNLPINVKFSLHRKKK